jgi:thiol-disulfide isomerase/thioredoxin
MVRVLCVLSGVVLAAVLAVGQQDAIEQRIHKLRSLPDDARAVETKKLVLEIRALPNRSAGLGLSLQLSNFATEGDFGRDTLHEVAVSIVDAIQQSSPRSDEAFAELARLVHYERVDLTLDDPRFRKAMGELDARDKVRQDADFALKDLSGKEWDLKKLQGKIVLVNFWATWCPPCRKEMPDLQALSKRFTDKGLVILAISDEEEATVRPFIAAQKYTYPILVNPGGVVNKRFLIGGIPQSLVYDRSGNLVAQSSDMRTMGQFLEMLKQAGLNSEADR